MPAQAADPASASAPGGAMAPRTERAVLVLAVAVEQLAARLEHLEARVDALATRPEPPTATEVSELRRRTNRVTTEVVRLDIELRSEMAALSDQVRAANPRAKRVRQPAPRPRPGTDGAHQPASRAAITSTGGQPRAIPARTATP